MRARCEQATTIDHFVVKVERLFTVGVVFADADWYAKLPPVKSRHHGREMVMRVVFCVLVAVLLTCSAKRSR